MTTAWGSVWRRLSAWSTLVWQISHRLSGRLLPKYSASSVTARLAPRRWISTLLTSSSLSMSVEVCSRFDLSFSETAGRSVSVPGRLQLFLDPRLPSFSTVPMKISSATSLHTTEMRPSSMKSLSSGEMTLLIFL